MWENLKAFQILADKTLMRVECNVMFSCLRGHGVQLYNHWLPYIYTELSNAPEELQWSDRRVGVS